MRRMITTLALAGTMVLAMASVALAEGPPENARSPTCSQYFDNHGAHILEHYVGGADGNAGGGKPAHFGASTTSPGATFCLEQANAATPTGPPAP
ncbi:MAG: hypothetical protein U9N56_02560 [Actinomycetota bacterium]|nr:hypothetical protein [Actinomycetota bacterium]